MKALFSLIFICLLTVTPALAADYGDQDCNIFVSRAQYGSGAYSRYGVEIWVAKNLIRHDFKKFHLSVLLGSRRNAQITEAKLSREDANYLVFDLEVLPGPTYRSDSESLIAFISNGMDTLYDNNFSGDMIHLNQANRWSFRNSKCQ